MKVGTPLLLAAEDCALAQHLPQASWQLAAPVPCPPVAAYRKRVLSGDAVPLPHQWLA